MNTARDLNPLVTGLIDSEVILRRAREERDEALREALAATPAFFKRLFSRMTADGRRLPPTGLLGA